MVCLCAGRTVIPMKLLKELALGNIQPMMRNFKKDKVYAKLLAEVTERLSLDFCPFGGYYVTPNENQRQGHGLRLYGACGSFWLTTLR